MILMQLETPSRRAHRASCASKQRRDHRKKKRHSNYHLCCTKETNKKYQRSSFFSLILFCSKYARFLCEEQCGSVKKRDRHSEVELGLETLNTKLAEFFL